MLKLKETSGNGFIYTADEIVNRILFQGEINEDIEEFIAENWYPSDLVAALMSNDKDKRERLYEEIVSDMIVEIEYRALRGTLKGYELIDE